jgi:hypothetical protein
MKKILIGGLISLVCFGPTTSRFQAQAQTKITGIRRDVPNTAQSFSATVKTAQGETLDRRPTQFKLTILPDDVVNLHADSQAKSITISTVMMPNVTDRRVRMSELENGAKATGLSASEANLGESRQFSLITLETKGQKTLVDISVPVGVPVEIVLGDESVYKANPETPVMLCGKKQIPGARQLESAYFEALMLNSKTGIRVGTPENTVEIQPKSTN